MTGGQTCALPIYQVACDTYTLPAITGTNLTGNESYYDATNGGGTQYLSGAAITTPGVTTLYIYDATGTTPNCFDEDTFTVTINPLPVVTASNTGPYCAGDLMYVLETGVGATSWSWSSNGAEIGRASCRERV